jgi:hypothetical protein
MIIRTLRFWTRFLWWHRWRGHRIHTVYPMLGPPGHECLTCSMTWWDE